MGGAKAELIEAVYSRLICSTEFEPFEEHIIWYQKFIDEGYGVHDKEIRRSVVDSQLLEYDLFIHLYDQLPRDLREKLVVHEIKTDSYHIRATAIFKDGRGRQYQCELETEQVGQWTLACKIPEQFLAHLCAVV